VNDAELALLSLLSETKTPQTDAELHSLIEARGLRRWTAIGVSSMYYMLEKLGQQGLIEMLPELLPTRRWRLTEAGNSILQTAVSDLLGTPHAPSRSFELGLVNLHLLKTSQVRAALQNYRQALNTRRRITVSELEKEQGNTNSFQVSSFYSHALTMIDAETAWVERFIAEWEAQAIEDPIPPIRPAEPIPRIQQVVLPQDPDSVHKGTTLQNVSNRVTPRSLPNIPPNGNDISSD
jgi:DNA-binding PadR family transcriptional regulator